MGSSKPTPPHNKATVSRLGRGRFSQMLPHSMKQKRPVCHLRLHKCLMSGADHLPDTDVLRPQMAGPVHRRTHPTVLFQDRTSFSLASMPWAPSSSPYISPQVLLSSRQPPLALLIATP